MPERKSSADNQNLLAVLEEDRGQAVALFGELTHFEQMELVRSAPVSSWAELLTLAEDCTELVRSLEVTELYRFINTDSITGVGAIVSTASPEQIKGVLDLSVWQTDELDETKMWEWLEWMYDMVDDDFARCMDTIDPQLLATACGPHMEISSPDKIRIHQTKVEGSVPDAFTFDDELVDLTISRLHELVPEVYDDVINRIFEDPWEHDHSKKSGLVDQKSEALFARRERLGDQDLLDTEDAKIKILRPLEIEIAPRLHTSATNLAVAGEKENILDVVIAECESEEEVWRFKESLANLATVLVMSKGGDPAQDNALQEAADQSWSYVSLALDALGGGSSDVSAEIAATWDWIDLYRAAHTLVTKISSRVDEDDADWLFKTRHWEELSGLFTQPVQLLDHETKEYRLPNALSDLILLSEVLDEAGL